MNRFRIVVLFTSIGVGLILTPCYANTYDSAKNPAKSKEIGQKQAPQPQTQPQDQQSESLQPILTIAMEAGGEPYLGQLAVGEVIRNRAKSRKKSFMAVVREPKQFSCWNSPEIVGGWANNISAVDFQKAAKAWHESEWTSVAGGAEFYHTTYVQPGWDKKMKKTFQVGHHIFFKES